MPNWINKANLYILGWCLYTSQSIFLPKGTIFSQLLLIFLLLSSLYYVFIANTRYKALLPKYFWGLNALVLMFTVYGVFLMIGGYNPLDYAIKVNSFNYLKTIYISLLPIYAFFVFFKEKTITEKMVYIWIFVFFVMATATYFENQKKMMLAALINGSKAEEFTNNIGYSFLVLLSACTFLYKKPIIQYIAIGYCLVFLVMAMKRGAIIIGIICLIWLLWNNLKIAQIKTKISIILLSVILLFAGYQFIQRKMGQSIIFQKRIIDTLEGNSSHRDELYTVFANYFLDEATPLQFIFGSGANATLTISYNYAHNDWLEIAVNQGLFGILVYMFYWILFTRESFSKSYAKYPKLAMQVLFLIYFMRTLVSMSYGGMSVYATFILGYCLAQERKNEQIIYSN